MHYEAFVSPALHNFMDFYQKYFTQFTHFSIASHTQKLIYLFLFSKPTFWNGMILRIWFFLKNYFPRNKEKKSKSQHIYIQGNCQKPVSCIN